MTRLHLTPLFLLLGACSASSSSEYTDTDSTSMGIEAKLRTQIGDVAGSEELQFTKVVSAFLLSDGRVVAVNNRKPPEIRVFSPDGKHLVSFGREGGGPREFKSITWARPLRGDTIVVCDIWLGRLTYFTANGNLVKVIDAPLGRGSYKGSFVLLGVLPDTTGIAMANMRSAPNSVKGGRSTTQVLHFNRKGQGLPILKVPDAEFGPAPKNRPAQSLMFGVAADIEVISDHIFVARGDEMRVDEYTTAGKLVQTYARPFTRRPVTKADVATYKEESRRIAGDNPAMIRGHNSYFRNAAVAEKMPATSFDWYSVLRDPRGEVWVAEFVTPISKYAHWTVFAPDGQFIRRLTLPKNVRVLDVGEDYFVAVSTDDLDVESVRVYNLMRK